MVQEGEGFQASDGFARGAVRARALVQNIGGLRQTLPEALARSRRQDHHQAEFRQLGTNCYRTILPCRKKPKILP